MRVGGRGGVMEVDKCTNNQLQCPAHPRLCPRKVSSPRLMSHMLAPRIFTAVSHEISMNITTTHCRTAVTCLHRQALFNKRGNIGARHANTGICSCYNKDQSVCSTTSCIYIITSLNLVHSWNSAVFTIQFSQTEWETNSIDTGADHPDTIHVCQCTVCSEWPCLH